MPRDLNQRTSPRFHGLLLVDKPGFTSAAQFSQGAAEPPTSHDIVKLVRRWTRQGRIGHTGTLDPLASGLLVLCLGAATRLVEYYQGHDKRYAAVIRLGSATDTYDALGQTTTTAPTPRLTPAEITQALATFQGEIWQTPPVYSALKQGGESLHRKARRGETVVVAPRQVTIYSLELTAFQPPDQIHLLVHCSAGVYIRSLAHDLAQVLGTVGYLEALQRLSVGAFTVDDAWSLAEIEAAAEQDNVTSLLLPPGAGLQLPQVQVSSEEARRLGQGQRLPLAAAPSPQGLAAAYDSLQRFLGIVRPLPSESADIVYWKAEKWLAEQLI